MPDVAAEKAGEAPEVPPQHMTWFNAYMELATCRTERGLIAWTDIARYAEVYSLPLETLRRIIRRIDAAVQADNDRKNKNLIKKPR